ncbi:hypothetical protein OIO90_001838 [Microbotryomycetes sp. JL221]|nr:hypothetical protein OIO90_001838 [Microbotryomycetes sp. JL221]
MTDEPVKALPLLLQVRQLSEDNPALLLRSICCLAECRVAISTDPVDAARGLRELEENWVKMLSQALHDVELGAMAFETRARLALVRGGHAAANDAEKDLIQASSSARTFRIHHRSGTNEFDGRVGKHDTPASTPEDGCGE